MVSISAATPGVSRLVCGVYQRSNPWGVRTGVWCLLAQHLLRCQDWRVGVEHVCTYSARDSGSELFARDPVT